MAEFLEVGEVDVVPHGSGGEDRTGLRIPDVMRSGSWGGRWLYGEGAVARARGRRSTKRERQEGRAKALFLS